MKKLVFSILTFVFGILFMTNISYARTLPIVNNYDYSIDMFNTTYYISYDLDGGTLDKINTYIPENEDFDIGVPTKSGYIFLGWTGSNGNIPNLNVIVRQGTVMNLTFKAHWGKIVKGISYNLDNGSNYGSFLYKDINTGDIKLSNPYREGYTFEGWTGSNGSTKQKNIAVPSNLDSFNYKANWSLNTYNISYSMNDTPSYATTTHNSPKTSYNVTDNFNLVNPTRTGYNFAGWTGSNGKTKNKTINIKNTTGDRWYKANWDIITYTISYILNNGTHTQTPSTYTVEQNPKIADATRTGYQFLGWTGTDLSSKTKNLEIPYGSIGNRSFTANWEANKYTIKFNANNGTGTMTDLAMRYDTAKNLTANSFTRQDYEFIGWATTNYATTPTYTDGQSVNNLTATQNGVVNLYAVWKLKVYYVSYNGNGNTGGSTSQTKCTVSQNCTLTANGFSRNDNWNFNGWNTKADGSGTSYSNSQVINKPDGTTDFTLYAQWKKTITLSYGSGKGGASLGKSSDSCTIYNSTTSCDFTLTSISTDGKKTASGKATLKVSGWDTNANAGSGSKSAGNKITLSNNATYYAILQLTKNNWTVYNTGTGLILRDSPGGGYIRTYTDGTSAYADDFVTDTYWGGNTGCGNGVWFHGTLGGSSGWFCSYYLN